MNIGNMKEIFKIAHQSKAAVKMVGKHGIGKSKIVEQFAKENGYHCEILQLPLMDEGDMMGTPYMTTVRGVEVQKWAPPIWVQRISEATEKGIPSIIFLDELGRAAVSIRQVALQMVLEGRLQEHDLGSVDGLPTLMVVADNPSDEYDTAEADAALESRFMSFNVEANIDDFLKYARSVEMVPVITDYLAEFTEKLHFTPETDGDKGSDPRSWEKLSDILKNTPKDSRLMLQIINSKIGQTVGANFFHYFNNYINVVKVSDIVKFIGDEDIKTEKEQRAMAKKLRKVTEKIELISAQELGNKMLTEHFKKPNKVTTEAIVCYLASLNFEIATSILKGWKESSNENEVKFYLNDFQEATPNRWYLKELVKNVVED